MTIFDYADYPTEERWNELYDKKKDAFEKIALRGPESKQSFSLFDGKGITNMEVLHWNNEFNSKAFDLANNYALVMHHYSKGIPDDEWCVPGERGGYRYHPHFEQKHHDIFYWFTFYTESYYTRFSSLIDTICHIINVKYGFHFEPTKGFNKKVVESLKTADKDLFDYLQGLLKNKVYKSIETFRNNITHNFKPSNVSSGIKRYEKDGQKIISGGAGEYTTSREFVTNIEQSIDLMAEIVDTIREKLQP